MKQTRLVDIVIDGKRLSSEAQEIELRIDGIKVYPARNHYTSKEESFEELELDSLNALLKAATSVFSHPNRFRAVKSLAESSKSFTEIKGILGSTSPAINFHLKTLINGLIIHKEPNGKYSLTLLGELVYDYFSGFLKEARALTEGI